MKPYLFNIFPKLQNNIPFYSLGSFPTPVHRLDGLCTKFNREKLYIKRDDISGTVYGGNKVRKLEFLIGDALSVHATRVITSGAAGSNHARATATYAAAAGLKSTLMLFDQEPSLTVKKNLLADIHYGAEVYCDISYEEHRKHFYQVIDHIRAREGSAPYNIPAGGSSPLGSVGFVNAAFELKRQISDGLLDEPDAIFVAFGTMGTVAGLLLGCKAAGLKSRIHAARVVPPYVGSKDKCFELIDSVNKLLHDNDPSFPVLSIDQQSLVVDDDCFGDGYAIPTVKCKECIETLHKSDNIELDPVYTGKCGASMIDYIRECNKSESILLWNTKNSREDLVSSETIDFNTIPEPLHKYFNT